MTQLRNLPRKPLINTRLRMLRRGGRIDMNLERDSPLTTRIRAKKTPSPLCVLSIRVCSRHSWAKSACSHCRVHLCSFVVSRKLGNTTAGKPAPLGHERTGSRESACAAELSWGVAYRLAGLFAGHRLANPARAATGDLAFRAGFLLAMVLNPIVVWLQKHYIPRFVSVILLMLALVAVTTTIIVFAIPPLARQTQELVRSAPSVWQGIRTRIESVTQNYPAVREALPRTDEMAGKVGAAAGTVGNILLRSTIGS